MGKYDDIIRLPHHQSVKHPQMPIGDRAAQFAAFAALTGYGDAIEETARATDARIELDEAAQEELNAAFLRIADNIEKHPEAVVTYFLPDERKSGGSYAVHSGIIRKLRTYERQIVFEDGLTVPLDEIIGIEIL